MERYRVNRDAEIAGMYRRAGDIVELTPAQARHLAPPLASVVTPVAAAQVEAPMRRARMTRKADADG